MNLKNVLLNLSFKNLIYCDDKEVGQILKMRNENYIRKNMFTKKIISLEQHHLWFQSLKNKNNHKFYCIYYKDKIIGGLSLKNINEDLK